jgi:hypothetical protein
MRVLDNTVLREIMRAKTDEIRGEWRRLHNEEIYALYCSTNSVRVMK